MVGPDRHPRGPCRPRPAHVVDRPELQSGRQSPQHRPLDLGQRDPGGGPHLRDPDRRDRPVGRLDRGGRRGRRPGGGGRPPAPPPPPPPPPDRRRRPPAPGPGPPPPSCARPPPPKPPHPH